MTELEKNLGPAMKKSYLLVGKLSLKMRAA